MRLPARGGIKRRLIEHYLPASALRLAGNHCGVELAQERIVVVEPVRHAFIFSRLCAELSSAFCHASLYLYPQPVLNNTTRFPRAKPALAASFCAATTIAAPPARQKCLRPTPVPFPPPAFHHPLPRSPRLSCVADPRGSENPPALSARAGPTQSLPRPSKIPRSPLRA